LKKSLMGHLLKLENAKRVP